MTLTLHPTAPRTITVMYRVTGYPTSLYHNNFFLLKVHDVSLESSQTPLPSWGIESGKAGEWSLGTKLQYIALLLRGTVKPLKFGYTHTQFTWALIGLTSYILLEKEGYTYQRGALLLSNSTTKTLWWSPW